MNSYERVIKALKRQEPDRVPICEMFINGNIRKILCSSCTYAEFIEKIDIDVVTIPSSNEMKRVNQNLYVDAWGVVYQDTGEWEFIETKFPISSKDDLLKYTPPNPLDDFRLKELKTLVDVFKGKKGIVFLIRDAFSRPRKLMGMEKLLISYITDKELVNEVIRMSLDYNLVLLEKAIEIGADIIISADDYASTYGPIMSPAHFKEFVLPGLTRLVKRTHELDALYIKHSDGNLWPIIEMLVDTGIDGLHPIDPNANMNMKEVKDKYGKKICLIGNIDCMHLLTNGSKEDVEKEVIKLISSVAPGGGFMISSSNSIHSGVKPNNFITMIETAKKYGMYPINKDLKLLNI